jgi:hypothetical protein
MRRIAFVPKPSGFRFYHTHVVPMNNLSLGQSCTLSRAQAQPRKETQMTSLVDLVRERKAALEREQRAFLGDLEGRLAGGRGRYSA